MAFIFTLFVIACAYGFTVTVAMMLFVNINDTSEWWALYALAWPISPLLYLLRRTVWRNRHL